MTGVEPGAVVKVTMRSGDLKWDGELCDVDRVFLMYGNRCAAVRSWWNRDETVIVMVNDRSVELVAPPVSEVRP